MMIFELLAVITIIFMITQVAQGMAKAESVIKVNIANDLILMTNTLVGVPGDAVVEYPLDVSEYTIILGQEKLSVFKKGDPEVKKADREFNLPTDYTSGGSIEQKARACLEKNGKAIILRECKKEEIGK